MVKNNEIVDMINGKRNTRTQQKKVAKETTTT